jgi:uncharacterized cupredoxin-like copper-binding protein
MVKFRYVLGFFLVMFLLVLAACGSSTTTSGSQQGQTTPSGSQTVQVTLSDTKVDSSLTTFTAGMPYHFVVMNTGQVAHQFVMMPMGIGMEHMSVNEMHQAALYMYDSVAPGESRMFDYTFAQSAAGQSLQFACGTRGQYATGMQLPFMVQPHG